MDQGTNLTILQYYDILLYEIRGQPVYGGVDSEDCRKNNYYYNADCHRISESISLIR